jgi:hypothetical protein
MKTQNTIQKAIVRSNSIRIFQRAWRFACSTPGRLLLVTMVLFSLISLPILTKAQEGNQPSANHKHELTGNWMVTITRVNPPPGLAPTFLSLMTYSDDGNFLEESNTTAIRSTHRGSWEQIAHQQFGRSSTAFRFDAARNYLGTSRLTATVTLSEDGTTFQAEAQIQNFDPAGTLLVTSQSTESGQRL